MDWTDLRLLASVAAGLLIALLLSTANTIKARLASVAAGLFFAVFLTQPIIGWAGLEFSDWQYAVAGLLAMTGDRMARRIMTLVDTARPPFGGSQR